MEKSNNSSTEDKPQNTNQNKGMVAINDSEAISAPTNSNQTAETNLAKSNSAPNDANNMKATNHAHLKEQQSEKLGNKHKSRVEFSRLNASLMNNLNSNLGRRSTFPEEEFVEEGVVYHEKGIIILNVVPFYDFGVR